MFEREINLTLKERVASFPITALTGPRQSGKSTLLKLLFPEYEYLNLETPSTLQALQNDPLGFLAHQPGHFIIDEAQRFPEFFSYLQEHVDTHPEGKKILLSGSQNFLLSEHISQTLAGRAAILELLPLTYQEFLTNKQFVMPDIWQHLYAGSYPRPYHEHLDFQAWYNSYIRTYVERDVRSIVGIKDLNKFQLFLKLCAGRHGQLLNMTSIGNDCGVSQVTIEHWLSVLESTYILYRLQPYYRNFNKRLVKSPKLYFYDSALVCHLLGITSGEQLRTHVSRGAVFEGYIISEVIKSFYNRGLRAPVYFWRDQQGNEIDLIVEAGETLTAIEIKSSATFSVDFLTALKKFQRTANDVLKKRVVVYTGEKSMSQQDIQVLSWGNLAKILSDV